MFLRTAVGPIAVSIPIVLGPAAALAAEPAPVTDRIDHLWVIVAAALVLTMQVGFLLLEAGMVRSKNSINVAQKNLLDFAFATLTFAVCGFMLAFGAKGALPFGWDADLIGLAAADTDTITFFVFQVMFCGTAATIVSGAVAERMRLSAYIVTSVAVAGLFYPVFVHWAWGHALGASPGAFLADRGFVDFAGSTVVHATGGWIALAACLVLGPRLGRFGPDGRPVRIAGHSPVIATAGAFLLFFGWLGFNGGSELRVDAELPLILLNTLLAGAAGGVAGYAAASTRETVIPPERAVNGMLGGLVAVTAGCHLLTPLAAMTVGVLGAFVALAANRFIEETLKVDDAVGAIGVHGFAGVAGTLALAVLAPAESLPAGGHLAQFATQLAGVAVNFAWSFVGGLGFFLLLDRVLPVRVTPEAERRGLNEAEHGSRMGIGHVEDALGALVSGRADLAMRLPIEPGDEAEALTGLFNRLMDNLEEQERHRSDQAERVRAVEEAERLAALANATFEALAISVDGRLVDGNKALEDLIGRPVVQLAGTRVADLVAPRDRGAVEDALRAESAGPYEIELVTAAGEGIPVEIRERTIVHRGVRTRVSAIVDLRERKAAEARIYHLAQHDPLTDLANRALFSQWIGEMVARTAETGGMSALLLVDLDRFKDINDLHGHPAGDHVITTVAERLRAASRRGDGVARLGGDEFAVLQHNIGFANQAADLAHRLVAELSRPIALPSGEVVHPGASIGVAICPRDGDEPESLVARADTALYMAKNAGRNRYAMFAPGMDEALRKRQQLEQDLAAAVERDEFEMHFQPRLDVAAGRITGYEALLRWRHPTRGLVSPVDFIPVAEQSGHIVRIGEWAIEAACAAASTWTDGARVSVNVSPRQFREKDFGERVAALVAAAGMDPARVELEVTESVLMEDDRRAGATLAALKRTGFRIALDDFGTGYSSLGYLSRYPFDTIKIDRSFVRGMEAGESAPVIVETIITLARALGMSVVAEGVEDLRQFEALVDRGVDEVQGYLIGRPAGADRLARAVPDEVREILAHRTDPKRMAEALRQAAERMSAGPAATDPADGPVQPLRARRLPQ